MKAYVLAALLGMSSVEAVSRHHHHSYIQSQVESPYWARGFIPQAVAQLEDQQVAAGPTQAPTVVKGAVATLQKVVAPHSVAAAANTGAA